MGTLSARNLILTNGVQELNFMNSLNTISSIAVLTPLFDKSFELTDGSEVFHKKLSGAATIARVNSVVKLATHGTGDRALYQSQYVPGQSGCTRIISITATLQFASNPSTGVISRVGSFDDANDKTDSSTGDGFYFEWSEGTLFVVKRYSDPTQSEQRIAQSDFNLDRLDGNGISRYTLDLTTPTTFIITFDSRVDSVRLGISARGSVYFVHRFDSSSSSGNIRSGSLPIRFEIASDAPAELDALSGTVYTSGSVPRGIKTSCGTGAASRDISISTATSFPMITVRLRSEFVRASLRISAVRLISTSAALWELRKNAAIDSPTWKQCGNISEFDMSSTNITDEGTLVASGYIKESDAIAASIEDVDLLSGDIAGMSEMFTLKLIPLMSSCLAWASFDFAEVA